MTDIQRYHAADLPALMEKISRNSIGLDNYFEQFFDSKLQSSNYPPFNLIQLNNHESTLEVALAGFKENELKVYTEFGKLHVEGTKETEERDGEYLHRGLAQRSFKRTWTISEDCEVRQVVFADGLLTVKVCAPPKGFTSKPTFPPNKLNSVLPLLAFFLGIFK